MTSAAGNGPSPASDHTLEPALIVGATRARLIPLLLATVSVASALTGCALMDLARDCEGAGVRVEEMAALDILDSRPDDAGVARGFGKVDAGCWSDSGDVVVSAERTYTFPGARGEVAAHYRAAAQDDGWRPDPDAGPDDLSFVKKTMSLQIVFLTAEHLAEVDYGSRPDLSTGTAYSISVESYE
ncbi:hypothetical protein ACFU9Y_10290 [Streptomyces sp. NPDC057621]|uniref:hypothetical protein n=1 Tax=Streptomyces sp. NPDC057621 TaxID=3346186 RepID=UPI0036C2E065